MDLGVPFMYDSGASYIAMDGPTASYLFGPNWRIPEQNGIRGVDWNYTAATIASGELMPNLLLKRKQMVVSVNGLSDRITADVVIAIRGSVTELPNGGINITPTFDSQNRLRDPTEQASNLFGLTGISQLKDLKIKFI